MNARRNPLGRALDRRDWPLARKLLRAALKRSPDHHWYLTRLSWVAACQGRGAEAVRYSRRALMIQPRCPLALWDYAGALHAAGRSAMASPIYHRLIRRGVEGLAHGTCGEGVRWARGLVADCHA